MWRTQQNHTADYYFCSEDERSFNTKNKRNMSYPNLSSTIYPVIQSSDIPVLYAASSSHDIRSDFEDWGTSLHQGEFSPDFSVDEETQPFSQSKLNNIIGI